MFGQLTGGLEAAWSKLKGEGSIFILFCLELKLGNPLLTIKVTSFVHVSLNLKKCA